jgi:hypothetical protein
MWQLKFICFYCKFALYNKASILQTITKRSKKVSRTMSVGQLFIPRQMAGHLGLVGDRMVLSQPVFGAFKLKFH